MRTVMTQDIPPAVQNARITALEKKTDALEAIQAQFTTATSEIVAMLNAITDELLKDYDEQERQDFARRVGVAKLQVIKMMKDAADEVERSNTQAATAPAAMDEGLTANP